MVATWWRQLNDTQRRRALRSTKGHTLRRTLPPTASQREFKPRPVAGFKRQFRLTVIGLIAVTSIGVPAYASQATSYSPEGGELSEVVNDPWMPLNRQIFQLNAGLDDALFAPITHVYVRALPARVRGGLGSAVRNLREPRTVLNDLAQGHGSRAGIAASRFAVNSTLGVLGFFDVATQTGLLPHRSDFGQTLGRYGVMPGPYLVLPVLGPHNVRDAIGRLIDTVTNPVALIAGGASAFGLTRQALSALEYRSDAEAAVQALADASDPYATTRSAYGQRRDFIVREATGEAEVLPSFDLGAERE